MTTSPVNKQLLLRPDDLGLNAQTFATELTSSSFDIWGWDQMDIYVFHDYTAATGVQINLDTSPIYMGEDATPDFYETVSTSVSSGTGTMSNYTAQITTGADARFSFSFTELNGATARLAINDLASGTTDTVTVHVVLKRNS